MQLMASREREGECAKEEGVGESDDGFTLCVSAAVATTGWHHAQQRRRRGELVDLQLLCSAKIGAAQAHPGAGEARRRQQNGSAPQAEKNIQHTPAAIWWHLGRHFARMGSTVL